MKGRPTGAAHPRWNAGPILSSHGYQKVRVGVGHPLADSKGYAYSHVLVWCAAGNPRPKPGESLHHVSGDKRDDRITNLALVTVSEHAKLHARTRRRRPDGTFAVERRRSA
jgi:hypothetical protein